MDPIDAAQTAEAAAGEGQQGQRPTDIAADVAANVAAEASVQAVGLGFTLLDAGTQAAEACAAVAKGTAEFAGNLITGFFTG
jgi:hypothetical protein